ncbi:MAG: transglutaminase domain-containing protein [Candidatus Latescibacterota bacterium]|nr:MAG: transglutaminase domain-containing protein [Candidatus Latescibacterota bacterium]
MNRLVAHIVTLVSVFVCCAWGRALADERQESSEEIWYVVSFSGTSVGLARDYWVVDSSGVFHENYLEINVSRLGSPVSMVARAEEKDDHNGTLIRFRHEVVVSGTRMLTTGERQDDSLVVRSEGEGFSREERIAWEEGAVGQAFLDQHIREKLKKGETDFAFRVFDPHTVSFRTSRYVVAGESETAIRGYEDIFLIVEQYNNDADVPTVTAWLDQNLEGRRLVLQQMGMEILIERVNPEEISRLEFDPNFDVIRDSMIDCAQYPADPANVEEIVFRLTFTRPIEDHVSLDGPNQKVVSVEGNTIELAVSRYVLNRQRLSEGEPETFLKAGKYIQSDHPTIQAVADSIVASIGQRGIDEGSAELVTEIAQWVYRYITDKSFGQGFASAVDVMRTREGDCTEHAVLLAALLRAAGVPSRIAVGLAYIDEVLVGHMWTEAYIDYWRTVDSMDPDNNPVRIRIATSKDERALGETDMVNAYSLVGGMRVEVRESKLRTRE